MILVEGTLPEPILESVKNVEVANKITHQLWREDNTLLGYLIKDDVNLNFKVYPLREVDIGQLYAELDILGLTDYSIDIINDGSLAITDSINKAEGSLDINNMKGLKISRMKNHFESLKIRPRVQVLKDTKNFPVDGSKDDITNFQSYLDLLLLNSATEGSIKDANGDMQTVTTDELTRIIVEIKQFGLQLYQLKWAKEIELMSAGTIEELKAIQIKLI
jgi:hypothetical protein